MLRYAHRLRYHSSACPDLQLTSHGVSLAAKDLLLAVRTAAERVGSPTGLIFPAYSQAVSHTSRVERKFGPCGKSTAVPVLEVTDLASACLPDSLPLPATVADYQRALCKPVDSAISLARLQAVPMLRYPSECLASHPCGLHD
jgi:hypothetical protein